MNYALIEATRRGLLDVVSHLVEHGCNINIKRPGGHTPLTQAIQSGHLPIVKLLIDAGADVDLRGPRDRTPLMIAAGRGEVSMSKLLLDAGADVSAIVVHLRKEKLSRSWDLKDVEELSGLYRLWRLEENRSSLADYLQDLVSIDFDDLLQKILSDLGAAQSRAHIINALGIATVNGHLEIVKMLTKAGAIL